MYIEARMDEILRLVKSNFKELRNIFLIIV